jgi:hypothetical protein
MSRNVWWLLLGCVLWVTWCVLVIAELVPVVRRHVTMWPWLMAYALCLGPVIAIALVVAVRLSKSSDV